MSQIPALPEGRHVFQTSDLVALGFNRRGVERLLGEGKIIHPTFGGNGPEMTLWVTPDAEADPDLPEAAVCLLTGGVLCRGYAAVRHGLSNDTAGRMELAIPYEKNPGRRPYLLTHRTKDPRVLAVGIEEIPTELGVPIRITGPARTIVDLLRSRGRVGEEWRHGIDALRAYLGQGGDTEALYDMARTFDPGLVKIIETAAESFNGGGFRP